MTPDQWRQIEVIFHAAVDRAPDERAAFLDHAGAGDPELRQEVESLLAQEGLGTRLAAAVSDAAKSLATATSEDRVGQRIGPYRVTGIVGQGGMGAVYQAVRDDDQYRKQVAIKLVKRGLDTEFILSRFRHERQILASLEHPHIARLLDGGTTDDGLPYLVMEYIEGRPITDYGSANKLSLTERLKLFRLVCSAVQYAHQNLVVHRDLKPSNILVTPDGTPKLLDFGIAKLLNPDTSPEGMSQTQTALMMLTPDYASPEQVRGEPVTTATDVYSLGVVLYELLTGQRPHHFKSYSPVEIERVITQSEPERPSVAVSGIREQGSGVRDTTDDGRRTRDRLARQLRGDLDNIVLMALRKEPERRYSSVEQLSEDIRRHLDGRPVIARKDTVGYRAGKFIQRHKLGLAAVALVILSLVGGIVVSTY
jgi:serine/threonine protein kinase